MNKLVAISSAAVVVVLALATTAIRWRRFDDQIPQPNLVKDYEEKDTPGLPDPQRSYCRDDGKWIKPGRGVVIFTNPDRKEEELKCDPTLYYVQPPLKNWLYDHIPEWPYWPPP